MSIMQRNLLILGIGALVFLIGLTTWWLTKEGPSATENPSQEPSLEDPASLPGDVKARTTKSGEAYTAAAAYPSQTPLLSTVGAEADQEAVSRMRTYVEDAITRLERSSTEYQDPLGRDYELGIDYVRYVAPATVSYVFTAHEDTLGAHPNTYFRTFTFDLANGEQLALGNLFTPGSAYLEELSQATRDILAARIGEFSDEDMLRAGTAPTEENFSAFYLTEAGLVILFAPYQIGPYALGTHEVVIPYAELRDILRTRYSGS